MSLVLWSYEEGYLFFQKDTYDQPIPTNETFEALDQKFLEGSETCVAAGGQIFCPSPTKRPLPKKKKHTLRGSKGGPWCACNREFAVKGQGT